jgi:hypothetical protein
MTSSDLPTLQAHIHQLELEKSNLSLPSLHELEGKILYHSARTHSADPSEAKRHVVELQLLLQSKPLVEEQWQRNAQINTELQQLRQQVHFAEQDQRRALADKASRDLQQAAADYEAAAKATIRAYRRCMNIAARNAGIKGSDTALPPGPHIPLRGFGFGGGYSTYEEMQMGLLQFEKAEQS